MKDINLFFFVFNFLIKSAHLGRSLSTLLELLVNSPNIRHTYFHSMSITAEKKSRSGFQRLCFEIKNEDSDLKFFKICGHGMLSISVKPNKNVKWIEMAMVSRCLQLTVTAVFWVMGNSVSIVHVKYNALPTRGISVFNPAVPCPFSVASIQKPVHTKSKCCTFFPYSLSCRCVSSFTGRTCRYGNQSLWCTDQVNLLVRLPSRATGSQSSQWNYQKS